MFLMHSLILGASRYSSRDAVIQDLSECRMFGADDNDVRCREYPNRRRTRRHANLKKAKICWAKPETWDGRAGITPEIFTIFPVSRISQYCVLCEMRCIHVPLRLWNINSPGSQG